MVAPAIRRIQSSFLSILPRIRRHAQIYFRHVRCRFKLADLISEVIALAWKWFLRLAEKGKDACRFPSVLATYAAKAVRCGRRVCGQLPAKDVLSERAQQRHGFSVNRLPDMSTLSENPYTEALTDNTISPVPDQVAFRLDWPCWLRTRTHRDRKLIAHMARRERTQDLSKRFQLSPARVSQLRREYHDDWTRFTTDEQITTSSR